MANSLDNPNYYRRANLKSRSAESQSRAAERKGIRAQFRAQGGPDWSKNPALVNQYEQACRARGILTGEGIHTLFQALKADPSKKTSKSRLNSMSKAKSLYKRQGWHMVNGAWVEGKAYATRGKTKGGAYKFGKKRTKNARGQVVADLARVRAFNSQRVRIRSEVGNGHVSGAILAGIKAGTHKSLYGYDQYPVAYGSYFTKSERSSKASKAATTRKKKGIKPFGGKQAIAPKKGSAEAKAWGARMAAAKAAKKARTNPGVFGGLALQNSGVFGGLALTNSPFAVAGVGAAKLIGTGVASALSLAAASKYVDEYLPQLPVIGAYLEDVRLPDGLPLVGGMGLKNTIAGALVGGLTIFATQFAARKLGDARIAQYGGAIGAGMLLIGPALDLASNSGSGETAGIGADDLSGLALDNTGVFGGIALDNTGVFGDGMAYQIGPLADSDTDYAQASLGDAYYSGADFDVEEGEAMVQGRGQFQGRFGHPPVRIQAMGGQSGSASHLAGRKGHRWGWLVKMIGWKNVEQLAMLPPRQRVQVLKQLRENALATFKQVLINNREEVLATPEMVPAATASGAEGVAGAYSSFGSTIFGGQGL